MGEEVLLSAVDYYVISGPGSELARHILWQVRPWSAMQRCREIIESDAPVADRRAATELLRVVADHRVLPWIPALLADRDSEVQSWGVGVLDQLLFSNLIEPEEAEDLLRAAERHENPSVRETAANIREWLGEEAEDD